MSRFFAGRLARTRAALLAVGLLLSPLALGLEEDEAGATPFTGAPTGYTEGARSNEATTGFREGVVAVSHPLAAEVGARVLAAGGNAIDAAASIQFALNVVEPQSSGIGGGGFMMVHLAAENRSLIIDSREKAPAAATPDMFLGQSFANASTSGHSVGVPGTLAGIDNALRWWGTRTLADALAPAIRLAEDGFAINRFLAEDTASARVTFQPETRAIFRLPNGDPLPAGHWLVQPDLAKTFRLIAERGTRVFYEGEIARRIVEAQQRSRIGPAGVGRMSLGDLASYEVAVRQPVEADYRGYTIKSMPPPSSGGLSVIMMLKLLERFPLGAGGENWGFGGAHTMHAMIEAMRLTHADRGVWMGDADHVQVPVGGLLSECFLATRRALIDLHSRMRTPQAADPRPCAAGVAGAGASPAVASHEEEKGAHTTHFSVIDRAGNVVSFTTTIESTWGTGIMVPGYGFLLNNELTDFNFTPQYDAASGNPGANDVAPFKRPRSSMAPTMIFRAGEPLVAYGSPGGATIVNTVLNTTLNLIDYGMDLQRAIDAPRLSVTSPSGAVRCEAGFPQAALEHLAALGHPIPTKEGTPTCDASIGSVQAILIDLRTGLQYGGADKRREGSVRGLLHRPR